MAQWVNWRDCQIIICRLLGQVSKCFKIYQHISQVSQLVKTQLH